MEKFFRGLLIISLLSTIVAATLRIGDFVDVREDWQTLVEWDGDGGWLDDVPEKLPSDFKARVVFLGGIAAGVGFVAFFLVTQIGMLFFWRFARRGFLAVTVASIILTPFLGISVALPWEAACIYLSTVCEGAALAMAYYSPLKERFERLGPA